MDFLDKTAVIVCHDAVFGPPHELRDYLLKNNVKQLLFIGHPNRAMHDNHIKSSHFEYYWKGKKVSLYRTPVWNFPEYPGYVKDFFLTLFWSIGKIKGQVDYFIGLGNLNAFSGLVLRAFGLAKNVTYYVIDYIPDRFSNAFINGVYHFIEMICASLADVTWNYAGAMITEREKHWKRKFPKQIVVPNGIHMRASSVAGFGDSNKHELVYIGTLSRQQGIQVVLDAIPLIKKIIPDIRLTLIGKGAYRAELEKKVRMLKLSRDVSFLGFIDDPVEADKRLGYGALGIAMYDPSLSFVIYTEPGKVKRYLSVGIPVVMTDISPLGKELEKRKCGFVSPYDKKAFAKIVIDFFAHETNMKAYRTNALRFVKNSTWDRIFAKAFASV